MMNIKYHERATKRLDMLMKNAECLVVGVLEQCEITVKKVESFLDIEDLIVSDIYQQINN